MRNDATVLNHLIDKVENDAALSDAARHRVLSMLWDVKRSIATPPDSFSGGRGTTYHDARVNGPASVISH